MEIAPSRIQFLFEKLKDGSKLGEVTVFNQGRIPGSLALGSQLFRHDDAFVYTFGGGYVARNPGPVDKQTITLVLHGQQIEYDWDHTVELGRSYFGYRPIVQIEGPDREYVHLSFRPMGIREGNCWCRVLPIITAQPMPFGFLSRHFERTIELTLAAALLTGICAVVLAACAGALLN